MYFGAPQIIYLILIVLGMGISIAKFGEKKQGTHDFVDVFFGPAIALSLLWWGGFFSNQ